MRKQIYLIIFFIIAISLKNGISQGCPTLDCIPNLRVSVGFNCEAEIIPEDFLDPACMPTNYQYTILDKDGNIIPNPVTQEYFNLDLKIEVVDFDLDDTCTVDLIVEDKMPPIINDISGPGVLTCMNDLGSIFTIDVTENCDYIVEITDTTYFCTDCSGIQVILTWTVTDISNNQTTASNSFYLENYWDIVQWPSDYDIECEEDLPTVLGPDISISEDCEREFIIEYYDYKTGCSINRQWIITDVTSGLQTSHIQAIIIDNSPPIIVAPDEINLSLKEYNSGWEFEYSVEDNCPEGLITYVSKEIFPISCDPMVFKIIYTVSSTDGCGNNSVHATVVTVSNPLKSSVRLKGKKSCYSPFQIQAIVKNMVPPLSYSYSVNNITWSVTDIGNGRAMVNPGIGKVIVSVVVTDQVNCTVEGEVKYSCRKFTFNGRNEDVNEINLFPNPTTGRVHISGYDAKEISVFNMEGKLVKSIKDVSGNQMDLSILDTGLYMVKIKTNDGISSYKLIVM